MMPYFVEAACKYSRLAAIIYQPNHLKRFSETYKIEKVINTNGIYAVILRDKTERVIVFRGTDLETAKTMRPKLEPLVDLNGGQFVKKYYLQYVSILNELVALNTGDGLPLVTVGHSAGSPLAVLTAQAYEATSFWCYGSPRFADRVWWKQSGAIGYFFNHDRDTITYTPHNTNIVTGPYRYYIIDNKITDKWLFHWIKNWIKYTIKKPGDSWVNNHRADFYYINLKKALKAL